MVDGIGPAQVSIKQGQGITHALKDLVDKLVKDKNAQLSDGKISKEEWQAAIKVLDGIQQSRKANNQASIFGRNYLVHKGDKIDFSADEMNRLYAAMGVEIKGADALQQDASEELETAEPPETVPESEQDAQTFEYTPKPIQQVSDEELQMNTSQMQMLLSQNSGDTITPDMAANYFQKAGFNQGAGDLQRLQHFSQKIIQEALREIVGSIQQSQGSEDLRPQNTPVDLDEIKLGSPTRGDLASEHLIATERVQNPDGSITITYKYDFNDRKGILSDTQTIKENEDGSVSVINAMVGWRGSVGYKSVNYKINSDNTSTVTVDNTNDGYPDSVMVCSQDGKQIYSIHYSYDPDKRVGVSETTLWNPDGTYRVITASNVTDLDAEYNPQEEDSLEGGLGNGSFVNQEVVYDKDGEPTVAITYSYEHEGRGIVTMKTVYDYKTGETTTEPA